MGVSLAYNCHYELCDNTTSIPRFQNIPIPYWGIEPTNKWIHQSMLKKIKEII